MKIAITGKLSKPRGMFQQEIELLGHKFSKSVTKDTNVLVTGDNKNAQTNKLNAARKNGTEIWNENDFNAWSQKEIEKLSAK